MQNLHTHTVFSDGKNTAEEMVLAAIEKGFDTVGISDHSYTFFDESYCMKKADYPEYKKELRRLKDKYAGKINVLCGIEQDALSDMSTDGFDYIIGSVHYLYKDGVYIPVDEDLPTLKKAVQEHFGGDPYALTEAYYELCAEVVERTHCTIIGHFDLIDKFIEQEPWIDPLHPRCMKAAEKAIDRLIGYGIPFEINTGAMSRGCRTDAYPALPYRKLIKEKGGRFILSSDSHQASTIDYAFERYAEI